MVGQRIDPISSCQLNRFTPLISRIWRLSSFSIPRNFLSPTILRDRRLAVVQLYKALGGGWNLDNTIFKWTLINIPPPWSKWRGRAS